MSEYYVIIDSYRCNSCESCVQICPEVFAMSEATGKAEAVAQCLGKSADLERAVAMCPMNCIELEAC